MRLQALIFFLFISQLANSQQSLFNAPSTDITKAKKVFVQEQLNFNKQQISNLTVDYGLGKGFEVGFNVFQTDLSGKLGYYQSSIVSINAQKEFKLTKRIRTGTGIQLARHNIAHKNGLWVFQNFVYQPKLEGLKLYGGGYFSSKYYDGTYMTPGIMCGFDYEINKRLHTMGDAMFSKNSQSQTVMGIVYFVAPKFPISIGVGLPFNTLTKPALVIELTWVP